jgi:hypothetical protein
MDERNEEPHIPRLVLSAGQELSRAIVDKDQADWASIRSEDPRILQNAFYIEGRSTPELGKF